MQNYYRLLGVEPTATAQEIVQGYLRQRNRLKRLAAHDPAMKSRLAEVEAGYGILAHPRRRVAYDVLLAEEPAAPALPSARRSADERMARYAQWARRLNLALLAGCLLLVLDWALPQRQYPHETILSRFPVSVSAALSDPQLAYRVHTEHTTFRLPSAISHRARSGQHLVVWQTPLLREVQRISISDAGADPTPFQPYGGTIYGTFFLLPLLMGAVAAVGVWPGRSPETVVNTAAVGSLLAILVLVIMLSF
ncbi:J domain-containing protein [Hymenobacter negativus]|uniref:J domain-containing protein n=1 Tax=Hymenobacter negativus TaxID=2795026 RepID=A0ABS3QJU0_9BACT|nr:hypothetical protein [Hymenobacter negativus]MBO2011507.1 hypothetical protein [Hymenobacter negativus]